MARNKPMERSLRGLYGNVARGNRRCAASRHTEHAVTNDDSKQRRRHPRKREESKVAERQKEHTKHKVRSSRKNPGVSMEVDYLPGEGDLWNSFLQGKTSTAVRTAVRKSPPATISDAVRSETTAENREMARVMWTVQKAQ